ncbi:Receptor-like protein kinase family [Quillaja saponaria]|uniref:Receptor-like protein kinase family n=1 Tax=Quillaja saponaria TaxID=32244 RepID=A0AAD7PQ69_QUISA|nr:Receptor-like protein kinase family [Quillaja saponaria]
MQEMLLPSWKSNSKYNISRIDWQGDPCVPLPVAWSGLNCSSGNSLRIISLNLSSSKLAGEIATSLSNLSKLESLDLSNNKLSGALPEFLGELPNLKILNLSGNKFTGSVPKALKEKSDNKTLQLSLAESAGLGQKASSKKQKFVVPLVLSIAVLVLFLTVCLAVWKLKRKRQAGSKKEGSLKLKGQIFSYSKVLSITDNFKTIIGEGGFGKVYLGTLKNGSQVAAKLLSLSSMQGFKEFQSEARLLMILHHRNLVSLVGYADDGDFKALIYEYMSNGNLHQQLSDKNPGVLRWSQRLQIAVDTAYGVDYLHNGCKPPIIHRDLKTSNILLNESMQAKIADFGLCKAFANDSDTHVKTRPAGTPGYLDPQFQSCGKLNKKSDVYSFGIILFELITGQPAIIRTAENTIHILDWVIPLIERGDIQSVTDPRLQGKFNTSSAWKAVEIAMSCIPPKAIQRPDISHILSELKECLSLEMDPAEVTTSLIESQITEVSARIDYEPQLESPHCW